MRVVTKALLGALASLTLASCGGGGGTGNNTAFNPEGIVVSITTTSTSATPFSLVGLTVRVSGSNGAAVADGTPVQLQVSPPGLGVLSAVTTITPGQPIPLGEAISSTTSGGLANFRLHTRAVGAATLTASATAIGAPTGARPSVGTSIVSVVAGAPTDPRLTLQVQSTTIPMIPFSLGVNLGTVYPGSPYLSEVTLVQRALDGTPVNSPPAGGGGGSVFCNGGTGAGAALGSGLTNAALWLPAEGIEEIPGTPPTFRIRLCRSISLGMNSGRSVFFVVADGPVQGPAQLTASANDQQTGEQLQASQEFRIANGAPQLPGSVVIVADASPIYISTVNGNRAKQIEVNVFDGAGSIVPNPTAGANNVRLEIVGGGQGGERVRGVNGSGAVVQGDSISLRTANGIANATFESGTRSGAVTLRATSDRADNNVDNGIQDAVISTRQLNVSDGQLFGLKIQTQSLVDPVSPAVAGPSANTSNPDATYQMLITVKGVDRIGTAVPPNTEIRFGLVDEPQTDNLFRMRGSNGDPQENGTLFTGSGGFVTGGAGPGDTLLVLGENVNDDRDMEAARIIASVAAANQLTVTQRFNPNDTTGVSVDRGPVYPFIVGRARDGTISAQGVTNSIGVAAAVMTYPASRLGKRVYIWAQGNGSPVNGTPRLVTDVDQISFAGAGPATITVSTRSITANLPTRVIVCLRDAANNPIPNASINYAFTGAGITGGVDGIAGPNATAPTGPDGCINVTVLANRALGSPGTGTLTFSSSGDSEEIAIVPAGTPSLAIGPNPLPLYSSFAPATALLTVCVGDGGGGIPGVVVTGTCTAPTPAGGQVSLQTPVTTGAFGCVLVTVDYFTMAHDAFAVFVPPALPPPVPFLQRSTTCTITAGTLTGAVVLQGQRRCGDNLTPVLGPPCPP